MEDEICPHLALVGCGGISVLNNEQLPSEATSQQHSDSQKGDVVYGLCKFHASGREDLDVRMLLPPPSIAKDSAKSNISITVFASPQANCLASLLVSQAFSHLATI